MTKPMFSFWLANHSLGGQRSLEDVVGILGQQLQAMGHQVAWQRDNTALITKDRGYNIIVEGFTPQCIEILRTYHQQGARYVFLATEEPTPKGFNHGWDPEMAYRQTTFPEAAKLAEAIWALVPGKHVTDWYGQHAPTAYVELGYAPTLVRPMHTDTAPVVDFGFYGSLSPRRIKILRRLKKLGSMVVVADFLPQRDRDQEMRKAKVILQIRKQEQMGLVSSSRCNTCLMLGRPVLAEPHDLSKPWDEIVRFSKTLDQFYNDALMLKGIWRGTWMDQFDKFRDKLPPQVCVGEALALLEKKAPV